MTLQKLKYLICGSILLSATAASAATWQKVEGEWYSVAAQKDGTVYAMASSGKVQKFDGAGWTVVSTAPMPTAGAYPKYEIAGAQSELFVRDPSNDALFRIDLKAGGAWQQLPGSASAISTGADNTAFAQSKGTIWQSCFCAKASEAAQFRWMMFSAYGPRGVPLKSAAVNESTWALTTAGTPLRWNAKTLDWDQFPGTLDTLSAAVDGTMIGLGLDRAIYRWNGTSWSPDSQLAAPPGVAFIRVSASSKAVVWALSERYELYVNR
jgi:hypothetical protein